jgi:hypothetical protein
LLLIEIKLPLKTSRKKSHPETEVYIGLEVVRAVIMDRCENVFSDSSPMFRRNVLPPSSGLKSKPNEQPAKYGEQIAFWFLELLFDPEDGGRMLL